ncbi:MULTISPECIES: DUF2939 domain-containing protein [unclassified Bradyrhizobium]|jgi:hypothetical protein|uniref:DUF2939 domain-containing protein n=1 Tax=unclassified Bradyrhizobium TaxID=2631580 RepID=UPI001FF814B8|nr:MULTISPECIES: DUF2939 domain-containing protein [unclassified Bradyrhizobium]MCK1306698.1 DUF2939 domain-containing protein [Bradyrhizobium sp. 45]MCK1349332.1 DUF2939 domain-containing protein [Bradyrhizobium sp. CW11]MCK1465817.1 DUF2939 domain-containing protein [Bradyrhizobium sp. CW10]MCK1485472.1 DUF2939 domain-containing protein [Bradyrhizobium sp. 193]MCK1552842.1 DUF2939 domain-containing protein [Bradyrhizobium sp. 177]
MRWFFGSLIALLVCLGIYVGSAVVSLSGLIGAVRAENGADVLARTDTARLRRSLVDQIVGAYLKQIGRERPVKPLERLAANTYGASIADAMIGKILTPENLTDVLNKGAIRVGGVDANMLSLTEIDTSKVLETLRRISPTKPVEFQIRLGQNDKDGGVSLHFEGNGWKLSGIQLPSAAVQALARSLMKSKAG